MNNELEEYLSKFKLKEPAPELERKIIANAKSHWTAREEEELSAGFMNFVRIYFTAAAMILVVILFLNSVPFSETKSDRMNIEEYEAMEKQLVKLGVSRSKIPLIVFANKSKVKINFKLIKQRQLL